MLHMIIQKVYFYTCLLLHIMRKMDMDYVSVEKEFLDKGPKEMLLDSAINSPE